MDQKFLAAYNEVVLDNFNSVLKQNLMFQTQIRFHEEAVKELGELREKLAQSSSSNNEVEELKNKLESYKTQLSSKDAVIRANSTNNVEKDRLQKAVNDQAKEIAQLQDKVNNLEEEKISVKKEAEQEYLDKIKKLEEEIVELKSYKVNLDDLKKEKTSSKKTKTKEIEEESLFTLSASGGTF